MRGIFVTGTDTGVGKTLVAAALIRWARSLGLRVGGMKPAESGCATRDGELVPADAEVLRRAAGGEDPLSLVCPYRMQAALAPGIAAAREGVAVDLRAIRAGLEELASRHPDGVVVEGAGGLLVPVDVSFRTCGDLAALLELPVLVVGRGGLGTINHTALTVEALRARGLRCAGVVLSAQSGGMEAAQENAAAIERLCGVPALAVLPPLEGSTWERVVAAAFQLEREFAGRKLDPVALFS